MLLRRGGGRESEGGSQAGGPGFLAGVDYWPLSRKIVTKKLKGELFRSPLPIHPAPSLAHIYRPGGDGRGLKNFRPQILSPNP